MFNFLFQYFTAYPDLGIFVAAIIFLIPVFLLVGKTRITVLMLASYLSYVFYLALPHKGLLLDLRLALFFPGSVVIFILGLIVIVLFFFFTDFVLAARRKFFFRTLVATLLLLMLFFSFYFELLAQSYQNFNPFIKALFLNDYSSVIWRGIPIFLIPFLL